MKPHAPMDRICDAGRENRGFQVSRDQRPKVSRARRIAGVVLSVGALAAAYISFPRNADLTAFDADAMARLESSMWRDYYEKRYLALFRDLYDVSRSEYGFSPLDSVQIAIAAAGAAKAFQ